MIVFLMFSLECLQWLFKDGRGDLFMTAEDGMGPIHAAAQAGQLRCLVWMVEVAGISPNHQAKDGATPAHFAAASGQVSWNYLLHMRNLLLTLYN